MHVTQEIKTGSKCAVSNFIIHGSASCGALKTTVITYNHIIDQ